MPYYVYIIQSQVDQTFYKGYTEQPLKRLAQHNAGEMNYSSKKIPWKLVALFSFQTKKEALIAEKKLKKYDHSRLAALINSNRNIQKEYKEPLRLEWRGSSPPYTGVGTKSFEAIQGFFVLYHATSKVCIAFLVAKLKAGTKLLAELNNASLQ